MFNQHKARICLFVKVYNESEMLMNMVESLKEQILLPEKIIIIDDGSPNPQVSQEVERLIENYPELNISLLKLPLKEKPNLDTAGRTFNIAWFQEKKSKYDFIATLDADTRLAPHYYARIIQQMDEDSTLGCASGKIIVKQKEADHLICLFISSGGRI